MSEASQSFRLRPASHADLAAGIRLFNRHSLRVNGIEEFDEADVASEWRSPGFRPEDDIRLAIGASGEFLGYVEVWNASAPYVRAHVWLCIDPEVRDGWVAHALLKWAEQRVREKLPLAPPDARVVMVASASAHDQATVERLTRYGMVEDRRFYRMLIDLPEEPPEPQAPPGYELRVMRPDEERATYQMIYDAFEDHYGVSRSDSFDEAYAQWRHFTVEDPVCDRDLLIIAAHTAGAGQPIVGASINWPHYGKLRDRGWVNQLAVGRGHRRKGIGEALLRHSFAALYRKGKRQVGLGVDAQSLTNATALYERCGMRVERTSISFRLELRAGVDYTNQG